MRSALNVTLGFGLASIPVGLAKLISDDDSVGFRTLHNSCSTPLNELKWCSTCETLVEPGETLKGFEVSKAEFLLFTTEEVEAAKPVSDRIVALTKFCPNEQLPDDYGWLRHYHMIPDKIVGSRYAAFLDALIANDVFGVGQSVLWGKRRSCVVRTAPGGQSLMLSTINQASPKMRDWTPPVSDQQTFELAADLVRSMSGDLTSKDLAVDDPIWALVEKRMGMKRKDVPELMVAPPIEDFQAQLRASMETKPSKRTKAKR